MFKRLLSAVLVAVLIVGFFVGLPLKAGAVSPMSPSEDCIEFIRQIEGFNAIPYWDYAQWTVGFGTKCPDADLQKYLQEGIPLEKAEELLANAMEYFGNEVNKFMARNNIQLTQAQFDALFSLSYNVGSSWLYATDNRLVQAVLKGCDSDEFVYLMGLRCNAGGKFLPALLNRRIMEADMYLNGRYDAKVSKDYGIVLYDAGEGKCEANGQGYNMNQPARALAVPTYEGYRFLGWYTSPSGGVRVTQLDASTNGMTLYAHWEKRNATFTVTPITPVVVKVKVPTVYVRSGPGTGYSVTATAMLDGKLVVNALTEQEGSLWGKCEDGWICLTYTDYATGQLPDEEEPLDELRLPANATVLGDKSISVYNGPHTTYPKIGTLEGWSQTEVLEVKIFMAQAWARTASGWVRLNRNLLIHDQTTLLHFADVTVTSALNVRSGPGTTYPVAGSLDKGDVVKIVAVETVGTALWGRCATGWISLQYTNFDSSKMDSYRNHVYGEWYDAGVPSCVELGKQRRDCQLCDQYETRETEYGAHPYGAWYQTIAPSYNEPGQERRDCTKCDHFETRETSVAQQPTIFIYGTVTGCDVLNVRSGPGVSNTRVSQIQRGDRLEILEETTVDGKVWGRTEKGWICITGYVTLEVVTEGGIPTPVSKLYATLTGHAVLNIREKAGTQYKLMGQLTEGERVEVLEQTTVNGRTWGRIDRGWVCITGYMTLETVTESPTPEKPEEEPAEKIMMTVTATSLSVRSGAGTDYSVVGYLQNGQQVEVLEQKTVGDTPWARIDRGWVSMKYLK